MPTSIHEHEPSRNFNLLVQSLWTTAPAAQQGAEADRAIASANRSVVVFGIELGRSEPRGQQARQLSGQTLGSMESEKAVGLIALTWLVGSFLLMARSIRSGRDLAEALATRDPATYEALGRPRPGYLESVRRTRFAQFVGRREFENLADRSLSAQFEAYRKSEARLVVSILASGVIVALLAFSVRHAA